MTKKIEKILKMARLSLIQEIPAEISSCEFDCKRWHCTNGKYQRCLQRAEGMTGVWILR